MNEPHEESQCGEEEQSKVDAEEADAGSPPQATTLLDRLELGPLARMCFVPGTIALMASVFAIFLPWTRYLSETRAGFRSYPGTTQIYEGRAGQLALVAYFFLGCAFSLILTFKNQRSLRTYVVLAACWSLPYALWLWFIRSGLGILGEFGLDLAFLASVASGFLFAVLLIVLMAKRDGRRTL